MGNPPRGAISSPYAGWADELAKTGNYTVCNTTNLVEERKRKEEFEAAQKKAAEIAAQQKIAEQPKVMNEIVNNVAGSSALTVGDIQALFALLEAKSYKVISFSDQKVKFEMNGNTFAIVKN